jgi:hypothetical protein
VTSGSVDAALDRLAAVAFELVTAAVDAADSARGLRRGCSAGNAAPGDDESAIAAVAAREHVAVWWSRPLCWETLWTVLELW